MKAIFFILLILLSINQNDMIGQTNPEMKVTELMFLVDITDLEIFEEIRNDFNSNLPIFFANTRAGKIKEYETFKLSVCPIGSNGILTITTKSIQIPRKGLATNEVKRLSDPQPLMKMLKEQLNNYEQQVITNSDRSLIIDVILKAISQLNENAENSILVVLSDFLEFSDIANFYKKIPNAIEIESIMKNIDIITLNSARKKIEQGCTPEVVLVFKQKSKFKQSAELKLFWAEFFKKIGIRNVVFIDNFTQDPQLKI